MGLGGLSAAKVLGELRLLNIENAEWLLLQYATVCFALCHGESW